jgi:hypothetical protein
MALKIAEENALTSRIAKWIEKRNRTTHTKAAFAPVINIAGTLLLVPKLVVCKRKC